LRLPSAPPRTNALATAALRIAVHRALELVLGGADLPPEDAARVAIEEAGLPCGRRRARRSPPCAVKCRPMSGAALEALARAGLRTLDLANRGGSDARSPMTAMLLRGPRPTSSRRRPHASAYVIDWKTDQPIAGSPRPPTRLRRAARLYAAALRAAGWLGPRTLRAGLLLTATGEIRWLD